MQRRTYASLSALVLAALAACSTAADGETSTARANEATDGGDASPSVSPTSSETPRDGGTTPTPDGAAPGPRTGLLDEVCEDWSQEVSATGARVDGSHAPLVAPDGKRIAYARCPGGKSPELVIRDLVTNSVTSLGAFPAFTDEVDDCGWARASSGGIVFLAGGNSVKLVDWSGATKASLPLGLGYYEARLGVRESGGVLSVAKLVKSTTGKRLALFRSDLPAPHSVTSADVTPSLAFDASVDVGVTEDGARAFMIDNRSGTSGVYLSSGMEGASATYLELDKSYFTAGLAKGGVLLLDRGNLSFLELPSGTLTRISSVGNEAVGWLKRDGEVWFVDLGSQYTVKRWSPGGASPSTVGSTQRVGLVAPSRSEALTDDKAFFLSTLNYGAAYDPHVMVTRVATGEVRRLPASSWARVGATVVWADWRDASSPKLHFEDLPSGVDRPLVWPSASQGWLKGVTADGRALTESDTTVRNLYLISATGASKLVFAQPADRTVLASAPVASDAVLVVTASMTPSIATPRQLHLYR